ncbi:MAG TPA: CapA family protein, partial [Anaerolineales bacterium]|nr:CapA family protein [Anaerolineales bacterium]
RDVHPGTETFAYLEPYLTSADLALANLESPLTDAPAQSDSPYILCARPENVSVLVDAGFDYLALSNNHRLDCGTDGLRETRRTLADAGLGFIGSDPEPLYRSINGVRLALLAFDATTDFDLETAVRAVRSAREAGHLVIVSMHWGAEYQAGPSTGQTQIAEGLADAGAALIWGHHPHVLQPSAWMPRETSTGDRQTLVFYSLGNALFDQHGLQSTRRSALALVPLGASGVEDFKVIPFLIDNHAGQASRLLQAGQRDAEIIGGYFK